MNNVLHIRDIQTSSGDIRSNEQSVIVSGKSLQIFQPCFLVHLGVKAKRVALKKAEKVDQSKNDVIEQIQ